MYQMINIHRIHYLLFFKLDSNFKLKKSNIHAECLILRNSRFF